MHLGQWSRGILKSLVRHLLSMSCANQCEIRVIVVDTEFVAEASHIGEQIRRAELPHLVRSKARLEDCLLPGLKNRGVVVPVR